MATLLEVPKVEYDLMAVESVDRSTDNIVYRVYKPDVPIPNLSAATAVDTPMNIVYSIRDLGEFFLLGDSYINVVGKFVKADGTALDANDRPALECGSTSFFSQSRLRLNSQLVEDNSTLSHINAFIRQLTTLSPDYVSTCGSNTGFILDTGLGLADEDQYLASLPAIAAGGAAAQSLRVNQKPTFNAGYRERRRQAGGDDGLVATAATLGDSQLAGSIERTYAVRLSDLLSCANSRKVMKNVSLRLELTTRTQNEIMFQQNATEGGGAANSNTSKFLITDMELVIAVHNPALDQLSRMEAELASGQDINYQFLKYQTFESDVGAGGDGSYRSFTFNTSSQKPIGAFLTCQRVKSGVAERNYNSMVFDNCNLTNVRMKVNGKQFPYSEYEPKFSSNRLSKNYARPYEELIRFMGKNYDINSGVLITADQWANLYPLYWIPFHNLSPSPSYQLTAEVRRATGNFPDLPAGGTTRSATDYKIYMVLLTVGEFTISGDRSGVIVRSQ